MISLKKADFPDIKFLWLLRNQPDVYKYFRKAKPVSLKEHVKWIVPVILEGVEKEIFVIYQDKTPVGQIRFDYQDEEAEISISVSNEFWGKGIASKALGLAIKKQKKAKLLIAEINKDNIDSIRLFEKLGFKLKDKKGKWLTLELKTKK